MNKNIINSVGFREQVYNIENGKCAICSSTKINLQDFRDKLSLKEFNISGLCQICQDNIFKI